MWWAYPLLWVVPLLTWQMVITRIRNIAEHAVIPDGDDPLRNTRTTKANVIERALIAPYFVNYHLEHHLLFYVPCYNLPRLHATLMRGPHAARMEVQPNYLSVWRLVTSRPDSGRPSRRNRQHGAAQACRHDGQRRPRIRGILSVQRYRIAIPIAAGFRDPDEVPCAWTFRRPRSSPLLQCRLTPTRQLAGGSVTAKVVFTGRIQGADCHGECRQTAAEG